MPIPAARPQVSVIMIAYNVERYIEQALESALSQEADFDYEVVVGEDGSTDRTREILLDWAERHPHRIRPILRERNLGMNRNFVETLAEARGRYVALLDADDWWTVPYKLSRQVAFLEEHPEFSICFHNALVVYEDQDTVPHPFHMREPKHLISHHVPKPVSTQADLAGGNFIQTCSVMFRAGLHGELPDWYLSMPTFDWPLHLLNAEHGDIGYIDEIMGAYRVHGGGFWSTRMVHYPTITDVDLMIQAYDLVNRRTGYQYDATIRGQLVPLYHRGAEILLREGRRRRAAGYAMRALRTPAGAHLRRRSLRLLLAALGADRLAR